MLLFVLSTHTRARVRAQQGRDGRFSIGSLDWAGLLFLFLFFSRDLEDCIFYILVRTDVEIGGVWDDGLCA